MLSHSSITLTKGESDKALLACINHCSKFNTSNAIGRFEAVLIIEICSGRNAEQRMPWTKLMSLVVFCNSAKPRPGYNFYVVWSVQLHVARVHRYIYPCSSQRVIGSQKSQPRNSFESLQWSGSQLACLYIEPIYKAGRFFFVVTIFAQSGLKWPEIKKSKLMQYIRSTDNGWNCEIQGCCYNDWNYTLSQDTEWQRLMSCSQCVLNPPNPLNVVPSWGVTGCICVN